MKNNIYKKVMCIILSGTFILGSMTGCKPNVEKVTDELMFNSFNSVTVEGFIEGHISVEADGENFGINLSNGFTSRIDGSEGENSVKMHTTTDNNTHIANILDDTRTTESYYANGYVYTVDSGNIFRELSQTLADSMNMEVIDKVRFDISNLMYKTNAQSKAEEMLGEKCYVFTYTLQGGELSSFVNGLLIDSGLYDEVNKIFEVLGESADIDTFLSYTPVDIKAYISKESSYLVAMDFDLTNANISEALKSVGLDYSKLSELLGVHVSGIDTKQLILGLNFYEYDNSKVTLPEGYETAIDQQTVSDSILSMIDLSKAEGTAVEPEVDRVLPMPGEERELPILDDSGNQLTVIKVPDGSNYYPTYSTDNAINIISDDFVIDCMVSPNLDDGFAGPYFKSFIEEGAFAEDYTEQTVSANISGATVKYYESYDESKIVLLTLDGGKNVVVSFSNSSLKGYSPQEVVDLVSSMIQ